jgi:HK97 family phage portal protein
MSSIIASVARWFGLGGALGNRAGMQITGPSVALVDDSVNIGPDGALQISTVWRCVDLVSKMVGSLPFFVYRTRDGQRELARDAQLYQLLHDSPNGRMTASEFWTALLVNYLLRGNGYARIQRDKVGSAVALWPMPADQVQPYILDTGELVYLYQVGGEQRVLLADDVLHIKDIGNGIVGLSKLDYMRATTTEVARAQGQATKLFANGNKPTGLLYVDRILNDEQRAALRRNFGEIAEGSSSKLYVLEAAMKYEQISLTPAEVQLLETRKYGVEEVCRWFGVPPVLVGHSNVTTWGSGIEQLIDGFYKITVRPLLVGIEQAVAKRVLTPAQRARFTVEFSFDALLRGSAKERFELYASATTNGIMTRNEARQLENLPPMSGGDKLTAQSALLPVEMLGKQPKPAEKPPEPAANDDKAKQIAAETKAAFERQEQRHVELVQFIARQASPAAPNIVIHNEPPPPAVPPMVEFHHHQAPVKYEFRTEAAAAPGVTVINQVQPTPVEVNATFEATIEPAKVELQLPPRRTDSTVTRDGDGNIVKVVQIEKDV